MKFGDLNGGIVTSCSGEQQYQIEISNVKNAKYKIATDVIAYVSQKNLAWQKLSSIDDGIHVTINSMSAQRNPGRSSDYAVVTLSVRFDDKRQADELDEKIRRIAKKGIDRGLQVRVSAGEPRLPVAETELNLKFFKKVQKLARLLEVRVEPIHRDISADICHVPEVVPVLGGFGPIGGNPHSPNEYIVRDNLIDRAALLALVIYECAK